jgi:hypothetical protein
MIQNFVDRFMANKSELEAVFAEKHPNNYAEIVKAVVRVIGDDECDDPDQERITGIDHGEYQGTILYVIAEKGYQPSIYWYVKIDYGSCSGCDTLQAIREYSDGPPTPEQVNDYMMLALHIVQGIKEME